MHTYSIAWSPDGNYIALGRTYYPNCDVYRFDGNSLVYVTSTPGIQTTISIAWSPDANYIALGYAGEGSAGCDIYSFNGSSLAWKASAPTPKSTVSIAWSPDGNYVALGNWGDTSDIYNFDGNSLTLVASATESSTKFTTSIAWSPDGNYIALGNEDQGSDVYPITYQYDTTTQGFRNGITFGNSTLSSAYDLDVHTLAAARINLYGKLWQDSVNSCWTFDSRDSYLSLNRYDSKFKITNANSMNNWKNTHIIKSSENNTLFLQNNQIWETTNNGNNIAPKETFEFMDDLIIPDNQQLKLSSNAVIDGQGNNLILGKYSQLLVDGGITVTFKNMTIKNTLNTISCPPIRCMDWYSKACFDNVTLSFNDDFAFRNGQIFVHNDLNITGSSKFSYRSVRPSYIAQHSNLIFNPNTTFEFYPSTSDNTLINMTDKTSGLIFDGSTLQTTHTGIRLTKGSLYFDNKVTLSSTNNTKLSTLSTAIHTSQNPYTRSVAWRPDGKYLAFGNAMGYDSTIEKFNGSSLTLVTSAPTSSKDTLSIAWSPDGNYVALGNLANTSDIYRFDGNSLVYVTSAPTTRSVAWSPNGKYLALSNNTVNEIYRFNGNSLVLVASTPTSMDTYSIAWSPDGNYLAFGNNDNVSYIYSFNGNSLTMVTSTPTANTTLSIAWSPNGNYVALGNRVEESGVCEIYSFNGSSLAWKASTTTIKNTYSITWSPDGNYIALGNWDNTNDIYSFDGNSLTLVTSTPESSTKFTTSIAWSPDGNYIALGNKNQANDVYPVIYRYDTSYQNFTNGIVFGNSALGSDYDLNTNILSAAMVNVYGNIMYDCIN